MNIKCLFSTCPCPKTQDFALLALRVVAGLAFVLHGWPKIQNPFGWMGPDSFAPAIFVALAALSEFGGGIAWMLGFLTRLASLGIASTMVVAVYVHAVLKGDSFVGKPGEGSYELALVYLCIAALLFATGPGKHSVDNFLAGKGSCHKE